MRRREGGITPQRRGRFPGFDVMAEADHWDDETRAVVTARLAAASPLRFFTTDEADTARAVLDLLLAQDAEPRVPVLEAIDARLAAGIGDGYRYHDLPDDPTAWRASLEGVESDARDTHGRAFVGLTPGQQTHILETVRATKTWRGLPGGRVFALWLRYACTAFYSHPWAWNEIGFPGPAYPRGYKTLAVDRLESFEVREVDPRDPVPWARKVDDAERAHRGLAGDLSQDRPGR